ncbi:hypothetical protein Kfla_2378 [Kribbella flavida DSM 17836]|uniref:Uncharacterized protein n=1 Tax=Kribbella flavida (strain DSM 17836 / JCM 10339 / NBRC 14399) TaxID=479435 RepID=D2PUY7_KRIFD|nr:hypothetical protein [Kribbella flavida]ADB31453.1 hypothetical protein Kfla_2378 [Kribbella flavida DSM 17836]
MKAIGSELKEGDWVVWEDYGVGLVSHIVGEWMWICWSTVGHLHHHRSFARHVQKLNP